MNLFFTFLRLSLFISIFFINGVFASTAPIFDSIGDGGFQADTQNPQAQKYFNQGMVFFYGFDYLEAIRSFEASLSLDQNCSRCSIALALSLGSITNAFIIGDEISRANKILSQVKTQDPINQGLLNALQQRYKGVAQAESDSETSHHCAQGEIELPEANKLAFSNALFTLSKEFPDNLTIKSLFAFSVLSTDNWDFYNTLLDIKPYANMMVHSCLEVLEKNPDHIGAIHYLVHGTEWSKTPQSSLKYAENLAKLAPMAEHLVHMPSHIYLRVGDYNKAVAQNIQAVEAYKNYMTICKQQGFEPVVNFLNQHNYDFLFASSILAGRADLAFQTAENIRLITPAIWLDKSYGFQRFYALQYYAISHFGGWQHLKPLEKSLEKYPYLRAMWAYAEGLHALAMHNQKDYEIYFQVFIKAVEENNNPKFKHKEFVNNLAIAKEVLLANKARMDKNWEQSLLHWHKAVSIQKSAGDPPEWYFSTILGLGYTFLDSGKPEQAILTFESSLNQYPENGWALFGIKMAYEQMHETAKAQEFENRFNKIWDKNAISLPIKQGSDLYYTTNKVEKR